MSCNTKRQQSTSLESYLIKPIQRILKYPLLLQQLKNVAPPNSEEQQHLVDALIGMERVAEHINEMQRIHEEYGAIFDHLFRQHQKASKSVRHFSEYPTLCSVPIFYFLDSPKPYLRRLNILITLINIGIFLTFFAEC